MQRIIPIIFLVCFLFFIESSSALGQEDAPLEPTVSFYEKAKILEVKEEIIKDPATGQELTVQKIKLEIISGEHKGEKQNIENSLSGNPLDLELEAGDKVIIYIEKFGENPYTVQIQDHYRLPVLIICVLLFLILLALIGKASGLKAIASLIISALLIFKVFIPLSLKGISPILLVLLVSVIITLVTLLIISGFKKKTYAAILGTISGLIVAAVMAIIFGKLAQLSGLAQEDARIIFNQFPELNFSGLLFAGMIIGALGAVMDVSVSVASAMSEIKKNHPGISSVKFLKSGLNVGRDIMGTMSNTLIFAYVGASLFVLLLFTQYGESYLKFLNFSFVAEEVIRSMAGSIGLITAIPLTALFSACLEN